MLELSLKRIDFHLAFSFNLLVGRLNVLERSLILVQVLFVDGFNFIDDLVAGSDLLAQLINLDSLRLKQAVTVLSFLVELHDTTFQAIEVFKHDESVDVGECVFSRLIHLLRLSLVAKCHLDNVFHFLRRNKLLFDGCDVWLPSCSNEVWWGKLTRHLFRGLLTRLNGLIPTLLSRGRIRCV